MLRRLIIATGTLGLILVGYGMYRSRNAPPAKPLSPMPEITVVTPASAPASQQALPWMKDLHVAPGKEATFEFFDQKGQLEYMMKTAEWQAESENELRLKKPELWKFMRNGQVLRITADSGQIAVEPAGKTNLKPKRGWLRDNVRISIDMTTRPWRQAHPDRDAIDQHPDRVIFIAMDSLYFDDDLSLIRTDDSVSVRSARFDIASAGLKMIYSRPLDRLEYLHLSKSGTISLRGDLDLAGQSPAPGTGVRPTVAKVRTKAAASSSASRASATTSAPASQMAAIKYQDIYRAVFQGPIQVQQYHDDKLVARLDSDKLLELVFDMAQQDRQGDGSEDSDRSLPAMGPAQQPVTDTGARTTLTWAGSLEIIPIERNPLEQAKRTTRIKAAGDSVVLEDKDDGNTITCQQLDYDAFRKSGRVASAAPALAQLTDQRGGYLAGQDIRFDQTDRTLEIDGAGEAAEPESAAKTPAPASRPGETATKIQWSKHLLVHFQLSKMPMPLSVIPLTLPDKPAVMDRLNRQSIFEMRRPLRRSDPLGGNPLKGLMAESAVIQGDALVQGGTDTMRAEKLVIGFFPQSKGKTFGPIQSAVGEGQVELLSKELSIATDSLDVHFVPVGADRSTPNRAIAQGNAVASQGKSRIAADFLDATLAQIAAAPRAEESPSLVGTKTRPAVVAMTATGKVHISDPDQDLDLLGDALTAEIPDGRQVSDLTIKGTPSGPARVTMKDYALSGPNIQANLQTQDIVVPSAGSLKLQVRQGPEGSRLDKPRPLVITWTDRMQMWGTNNQAIFDGHVQAIMASTDEAGEDTAVTSDHMTVFFRAVGQSAQPPSTVEINPALKVIEKARQEIAQVMPAAAAEWLPGGRTAKANRPGADLASVQREPVMVIAEGNAKAVSSRYDASGKFLTSRLLIDGPTFNADLIRQNLAVPGKGRLLLENYALVKVASKLIAQGQDPTTRPAKGQEDNLSQTVFAWVNGMTFALDEQLAVFDGEVNMVHRSGNKVVLGAQMAQALGAKPALLQVMPGRVATLNADNLIVQFSPPADKAAKPKDADANQWLKRAELDSLIATGSVYLNEELSNGGSNFLTAGRVQYSGQRDTFTIQGVPAVQGGRGAAAKLVRQKDAQSPPEATTMDAFWWNRRTDEVTAHGISGQSFQ